MPDDVTKDWIENASDEKAVANGCRFDMDRALHVCRFFNNELILYEGEYAGQPFRLMDWQKEYLMRAFGWVRYSKEWKREVRRFKKCSLWVPKKNGKSPMAAGVGLYLLCADGEVGQKVFSVAKDGKQARIVHTHAMEMVRRSPNLMESCKINKSSGRITFLPSTNFYDILSGENVAGQEGLNGCSITDEKHVVDARLANVLEYMGASRAEAMDFGVSTYGNNIDGYGKKDCDYGRAVEKGEIEDETFLHKAFDLPDGVTDEECKTPRIWKICNPSFGEIIKETEMMASCKRAERSLTDWLNFQMYRLNKWLSSSSPWIREDDWQRCAEDFDIEDFEGEPVWLGLDLSKTRDMSSLVLIFRKGEGDDATFYQYPYFWMPQKYADDNSTKADFLGWDKEDYLELIEGDTIRQAWIKKRMKWINEKFDVQSIAYDKTYALDLINEFCVFELGWDAVEFGQSLSVYAGPTENYETLLVEGRLKHNNHKVLSWQAGHVEVKVNERGDRMPTKAKRNDIKKIDGIVAGVMALNGAYHAPPAQAGACYEDESFNWISG
jgi:phage terminase large subunit-like protein